MNRYNSEKNILIEVLYLLKYHEEDINSNI